MIKRTNQQMPSPAELHRIAALHAARINFRRRGIEIGTKQFDFDQRSLLTLQSIPFQKKQFDSRKKVGQVLIREKRTLSLDLFNELNLLETPTDSIVELQQALQPLVNITRQQQSWKLQQKRQEVKQQISCQQFARSQFNSLIRENCRTLDQVWSFLQYYYKTDRPLDWNTLEAKSQIAPEMLLLWITNKGYFIDLMKTIRSQ